MCRPILKDENDTRLAFIACATNDKELMEEWKKERQRRIEYNKLVLENEGKVADGLVTIVKIIFLLFVIIATTIVYVFVIHGGR